jgi:hypothetical protein
MGRFIEDKRKSGLRIIAANGLVAQVYQQLYKPIVLSCLSADWVFELQPIENVIVEYLISVKNRL